MRTPPVLWLGVLAFIAGLPVSAQAQTDTHELNSPFAEVMTNPCTSEMVTIEGTIDTLVQMTVDESGGFHNKALIARKGRGAAAITGTTYVFSEEDIGEVNVPGPSNAVTLSLELNHLLTSAGPSDNFFMKFTFHLTFDGNGMPRGLVDNFTFACRG